MPERWQRIPWRLAPNRVWRFYRGGLLLDQFRRLDAAADTDHPEDWIGSATRAWTPPGTAPTDDGLSLAQADDAERLIVDLLAEDRESVAGSGWPGPEPTTGILVKLLDAAVRLPVHAHPSRPFARRHLGSPFGKAEAWVVLATRDVPGEPPPHVRLGFQRQIGRDELEHWIVDEQSDPLLAAMNARPTVAGDVWFVPPGTAHAIGAGVFLLEVQEPTDFSIVLETRGFPISASDAHLGLGWGLALDAVDRRRLDDVQLDALRSRIPVDAGAGRSAVLPAAAAPYFRVDRVVVDDRADVGVPERFVVVAVTAGEGTVGTDAGTLPIRAGDTFAIPAAAVRSTELVATRPPLEVLVCRGAEPEAAADGAAPREPEAGG